jgi:hypothetical protein
MAEARPLKSYLLTLQDRAAVEDDGRKNSVLAAVCEGSEHGKFATCCFTADNRPAPLIFPLLTLHIRVGCAIMARRLASDGAGNGIHLLGPDFRASVQAHFGCQTDVKRDNRQLRGCVSTDLNGEGPMRLLPLSVWLLALLSCAQSAGTCLAQKAEPPKQAPASSDQERFDKLIQQLAGSRFAEREQAMRDLIAIGVPALEPLRNASKSKDAELVRRAQECIPIIERNVQIAALLKSLKDPDWAVRCKTLDKMKEFGPHAETAVPELVECIKDENPLVSFAAMDAIASIGPKATKAIPALIETVKTAKRGREIQATITLGSIGPAAEGAVPALLEVLQKYPYPKGREIAAGALASIGGGNETLIPALIKALDDPDVAVREKAAFALGEIRKESASCITALLKALRNEKNLQLKEHARCAATRFGLLAVLDRMQRLPFRL